ncbi:hypothetical protein ABZT45_34785 [Streptomyces sp. NPDC005356]|uniref:hypothetical protein n=1 Tax=Streptomyces sp. NPDC005356 TaxID=3157167 RepID=UPI0033B0C0AE
MAKDAAGSFDGGDFTEAVFSGGTVVFASVEFTGGIVDLRAVASWARPPRFSDWVWADPPAGLLLPSPTIGRPRLIVGSA